MADNLLRHVLEHKLKVNKEFTKIYYVDNLVCFKEYDNFEDAAKREKRI